MIDYKCHIKNMIRDLVEADKLSTDTFYKTDFGYFAIKVKKPYKLQSTTDTSIIHYLSFNEGSYFYQVNINFHGKVDSIDEVWYENNTWTKL